MTRRILQILIWLIAAAILAIALVLVVSAGRLWLEYGDPDPALSEAFGREIAEAGRRDPAIADFSRLEPTGWTALSVLNTRRTPQEIEACLGLAWDKAAPAADILAGDTGLAIVLTDGTKVLRASWSPDLGARLTVAGEICAVPRTEARFQVESRRVEPGPEDRFEAFTTYHLTRQP